MPMSHDHSRSTRTQQCIADALGTGVENFFTERSEPQDLHEVVELLAAFDQIVDPSDRKACIDFVQSVLKRQRTA